LAGDTASGEGNISAAQVEDALALAAAIAITVMALAALRVALRCPMWRVDTCVSRAVDDMVSRSVPPARRGAVRPARRAEADQRPEPAGLPT